MSTTQQAEIEIAIAQQALVLATKGLGRAPELLRQAGGEPIRRYTGGRRRAKKQTEGSTHDRTEGQR